MARATYEDILLSNLAGKVPEGADSYLGQEEAYDRLKRMTGQDFGYDVDKWDDYLHGRGPSLLSRLQEFIRRKK
jgi:hypothetical protein